MNIFVIYVSESKLQLAEEYHDLLNWWQCTVDVHTWRLVISMLSDLDVQIVCGQTYRHEHIPFNPL